MFGLVWLRLNGFIVHPKTKQPKTASSTTGALVGARSQEPVMRDLIRLDET